jgi:hypothetical protein
MLNTKTSDNGYCLPLLESAELSAFVGVDVPPAAFCACSMALCRCSGGKFLIWSITFWGTFVPGALGGGAEAGSDLLQPASPIINAQAPTRVARNTICFDILSLHSFLEILRAVHNIYALLVKHTSHPQVTD